MCFFCALVHISDCISAGAAVSLLYESIDSLRLFFTARPRFGPPQARDAQIRFVEFDRSAAEKCCCPECVCERWGV